MRISDWSSACALPISEVIYPGLESHPHHELAKRQMDGFGGMLSIVLKGGVDAAKRFCERAELFTLAESLGGVESLVNHPAIMTHASIPPARRAELGIEDALVRSEEHPSELQSLMRISYAVYCLQKKQKHHREAANTSKI